MSNRPYPVHHYHNIATNHPAASPAYISSDAWSAERPHTLVVFCSDGRLQNNIDDFLHNHLGVENYDRLAVPGGPGALAESGYEFLRAGQMISELRFLIDAHQLEWIILIFHGATPNGPVEACCADYRRKLPALDAGEIFEQQQNDVVELLGQVYRFRKKVRVQSFYAGVAPDGRVHFTDLARPSTDENQ